VRSVTKVKKQNSGKRNSRGLLLATSEMMIIIPVAVLLLFIIADSAILACCKLKLGAVTEDSAKFIADLDNDKDVEKEAAKYVAGLLKASGQPVKALKVKVKKLEINDAAAVSVTVEGNYPLFQNNLLPADITLAETAAALVPARKICGYIAISPDAYADPTGKRRPAIYCPIIRPNRKLPIWTFPYETSIGSLNLERGPAPKLENIVVQKQDSYFNGLESIY
jgi:hypothetical protein